MGALLLKVASGTGWRARGLLALLTLVLTGLIAAPAAAADTLTVTDTPFSAFENQALSNQQVATFSDSVGDDSASDYTATIDWGDGTVSAGTVSGTADTTGPWTVSGSHTYAEEGTYSVNVTVTDTPSGAFGTSQEFVQISDAPLTLPAGTPTQIAGGGSSAAGAMSSFEASIGGGDNGTTPGEQSGGFRHITWDGVALNGSDPGSTTITSGHVVSVAPTRAQPWGVDLSRGVAVANDGFTSVNPNVAGRFTPFSSPNVFAPFNSNQVKFQIVSPAAQSSSTTSATTRAFGIMFLNVSQANTANIQYFSGSALLYTAFAPVGGVGQPSFVGVVFSSPAVTQVVVTMGTAQIFSFDGSTVTSGPADAFPNNLVAGDDVVLAEPTNTQPAIQATAGVPVSGVFDTFGDTDPAGAGGDYTAVVNWGDGSSSGATVSQAGGGFSVNGSHTFVKQGTFQVTTTVTDYGGATQTNHVTVVVAPRSSSTSVKCSPKRVPAGTSASCTATVSDVGGGTSIAPTGLVTFASSTPGGTFPKGPECKLAAQGATGRSTCSVRFIPSQFPPRKALVVANYPGDPAHSGSSGKRKLKVSAPICSIKLASKTIKTSTKTLSAAVKCGFFADIKLAASAVIGGTTVQLGHPHTVVAPGKKKNVRVFIPPPAMRALLAAAQSKQRVSLQLTVSATVHSKPVKTSVTVRKLRVS